MEGTKTRPDRTLVVILSLIVLLVLISVAAVLSRGEPVLYDESTPEGVVQRFATAVIEGDDVAAAAYLTDRARDECQTAGYETDGDLRVTLSSTDVFDGTADVGATITTTYGASPFGMSEFREEVTFELIHTEGTWKIDSTPWQLTISCQGVNHD